MQRAMRWLFTIVVVTIAILAATWLWHYYMYSPWTRDGRVQTEVITISPDVSGLVENFNAYDKRTVHKGDLLFTVDEARYAAALHQAEARADQAKAVWEQSAHQSARRAQLGNLAISQEARDSASLGATQALAAYQAAQATVESARLDTTRTRYTAPADGQLVNLQFHQGDFVTRGASRLSLIRSDRFYVTGYFEETKLEYIHVGDPVRIVLMSSSRPLKGHVTAIGRGISNSNSTPGSDLMPNVSPTFTWVRLAQRIPVDVAFDELPQDFTLSSGMTASLYIEPSRQAQSAPQAAP